jgi:hypothetical protein
MGVTRFSELTIFDAVALLLTVAMGRNRSVFDWTRD